MKLGPNQIRRRSLLRIISRDARLARRIAAGYVRRVRLRHLGVLFAACAWVAILSGSEPLLGSLRAGHPRLLWTDADLAATKLAAKTDPLLATLLARIVQEAEGILPAPPLEHRLIGPRMLAQSRLAVRNVLTCAAAFRLTGDARFSRRAIADMRTAAAFLDWNPSHFLDVAEMSFALAIGYDWLQPQLAAEERAIIREALRGKALELGRAAYASGAADRFKFVNKPTNWNQVCNGGLIAAALALAEDEPALAETVIDGALRSIPTGLRAYAPEGAYPEGPGYWSFGSNYTVITLAMLQSALGRDFGIDRTPGFDRTAGYMAHMRGPSGLLFNYADGTPRVSFSPAFTWLARHFSQPALLAQARAMLAEDLGSKRSEVARDRFLALNAVWFPARGAAPAEPLPRDARFRGAAETAVFRSAWDDPRAIFVGLKGGSNSVNHSHLDLGSFVLDADGVRWAHDLGREDYNLPGYFGDQRWSYFRLNNFSHNTLGLAGELQPADAVAPIVAFESGDKRAAAVVDLSSLYPKQKVTARRTVALLDRARVLVEDNIAGLDGAKPLRWTMLTGAKIALSPDGRTATLSQDGRTLRAEILAPARTQFSTTSAVPPNPAENQNAGFQVLEIQLLPAPSPTRLAVLLTPIGDRWPALPAPKLPLSPLRAAP